MTCLTPIAWEDLVLYWAGDLAPEKTERLDEHLMGCAACSAQSARVAAVVQGVRELIPPVVTRASLARLRARGTRIEENTFFPGRQSVVFHSGVDLLVHRLAGADLSGAARVRVAVRVESTGALLVEDPNAPFDAKDGVLIACQRHFADLPPDVLFEVTAIDASGTERTARYAIPHVFER
jgi:anti-sigma factor RsiW